jgi:hypothetical protein
MGKGVCTFKKTDVTRAFKAAKKAGVEVQIVINQEHRTMTLTPVKPSEASAKTGNEWDEVLPKWRKT